MAEMIPVKERMQREQISMPEQKPLSKKLLRKILPEPIWKY
jgi:hypothetical protein